MSYQYMHQSQPLVETSPNRVTSTTKDDLPVKKMRRKGSTIMNKHPVQVQRRNERERKRVSQVNDWFVTLRNVIPMNGKQKKLSKVETLRQAAKYIEQLELVLRGEAPQPSSPFCIPSTSSRDLCSPFSEVSSHDDHQSSMSYTPNQSNQQSPSFLPNEYHHNSSTAVQSHNNYILAQGYMPQTDNTPESNGSISFGSENSYEGLMNDCRPSLPYLTPAYGQPAAYMHHYS